MSNKVLILIVMMGCLSSPLPSFALRPMVHYHDLVAGEGDKGYRDGTFTSAMFDGPSGLAVNGDGNLLYVADRRNNRIRVVHLNENNRVTTLAGTGEAGYRDGALDQALFNDPTALAFLPGNRLVVNDGGNLLLRMIDLKAKTVATLAGNKTAGIVAGKALETSVANLWNMVYDPVTDSLYFSQPDYGVVRKLDMQTGLVTTVVKDGRVPNPRALCLYEGKLCVADHTESKVYKVEAFSNTPSASAVLSEVGSGVDSVLALAASGKYLYAMQSDSKAWVRLQPDNNFVPMSVWGYPANQEAFSNQRGLLLKFSGYAVGFVADPNEERRFYVTSEISENIMSLKDYDFWRLGNWVSRTSATGGLNDYDYPVQKPRHTFRILVASDSICFGLAGEEIDEWGPGFSRMEGMVKRLELELNTAAAINDVPVNFEVLSVGYSAVVNPLCVWPYYEVPRAVKKYDIDLFLYMFNTNEFKMASYYFLRPLNSDGIPVETEDPEFLLKPWKEKLPSGIPGDFYKRCLDKGWVGSTDGNNLVFQQSNELLRDKGICDDLVQMIGKPIGMLADKLKTMRTSEGKPVKFELGLAYTGNYAPGTLESYRAFWKTVAENSGMPFMDMVDDMIAFCPTYFPLYEQEAIRHYFSYGNYLFAYLLSHELIQRKLIPFSTGTPKN